MPRYLLDGDTVSCGRRDAGFCGLPRQQTKHLVRGLTILVVLVNAACAKKPPTFVCGGVATYPSPRAQVCAPTAAGTATLTIRVSDVMGAAISARIVLTPADGQVEGRTMTADSSGTAVLAAEGGLYAVTVVEPGFIPQVRPLKLTPGCTGQEEFTLEVVPWFE